MTGAINRCDGCWLGIDLFRRAIGFFGVEMIVWTLSVASDFFLIGNPCGNG